jgi:hypothetical protein
MKNHTQQKKFLQKDLMDQNILALKKNAHKCEKYEKQGLGF